MPKTSVDADAQAFLTAAAITDPTISSSINKLVVDLKSAGVWSKMKAIYPMVGGTASTHKFNLKDPRDLNAAFRLSFVGGVTHNSNGATFNGVNGYADTFFNPLTIFGVNYGAIGHYERISYSSNTRISGVTVGTRFDYGYDNGSALPFAAIGSVDSNITSDNGSQRLQIVTRQGLNVIKFFRDNVVKINSTRAFSANPNGNFLLAARNSSGTPLLFSNINNAFGIISDFLTDQNVSDLTTIVNNFQTTLNRQV